MAGGRSSHQQHVSLGGKRLEDQHGQDAVTLVGSLPRSQAVTDAPFARERGDSLDESAAPYGRDDVASAH